MNKISKSSKQRRVKRASRSEVKRLLIPMTNKKPALLADKIHDETLPNGLRLIVLPIARGQTVSVKVSIRAGKYFRPNNSYLLPMIVGKMLTLGSKNYSKTKLASCLSKMGMRNGLDVNVSSYDVDLSGMVVSKDASELIAILSDIIRNPSLSEAALAEVRALETGNIAKGMHDPRSVAFNTFHRLAYPVHHPHHRTQFMQELNEVADIEQSQVQSFHAENYGAARTTVVITGGISIDEAEKLVKTAFADWAGAGPATITVPLVYLPEPAEVKLPMDDKDSMSIVLGHPVNIKPSDEDYPAFLIANTILGKDTTLDKLGKVVREEHGLTYGINSHLLNPDFGQGPLIIELSVSPQNAQEAITLTRKVLEEYLLNGAEPADMRRAIGGESGSFQVGLASSMGVANTLCRLANIGLPLATIDEFGKSLKRVTRRDVNLALQSYFHPERMITVLAGTFET